MYQEEYKRWMTADLEDADLMPELAKIEGNEYLCCSSGYTGTR